jgi:uncharacterized protein (TIGR03066 family)
MRAMLGCTLGLLLCCGLSAEDKKDASIDAKLLVGKWEPKEKSKGRSTVFEYAKDGKLTLTVTIDGMETKYEATYKLDGNKLTVAKKVGDKEQDQTRTITKLTDTELVTADDKRKENTFVRVKDKLAVERMKPAHRFRQLTDPSPGASPTGSGGLPLTSPPVTISLAAC